MTQKEKQLLLKDLCARLPYGVKFQGENSKVYTLDAANYFALQVEAVVFKPYLRPMSSMTEEEEEYALYTWGDETLCNGIDLLYDNYMMFGCAWEFIDWLNEHHFDYHGLIEKGLALEAPEGMYKTE